MSTDIPAVLAYRQRNRQHLAAWEPLRGPDYYTPEAVARTVAQSLAVFRAKQAYPFYLFSPDQHTVWGSMSFANVLRGAFQACHLGYGLDFAQQGQGLMHEALQAGLDWIFSSEGLHRVMANYMPVNQRSARLLQRLGFQQEGYAREYLQIAGRWEDHVLTARLAPSAKQA